MFLQSAWSIVCRIPLLRQPVFPRQREACVWQLLVPAVGIWPSVLAPGHPWVGRRQDHFARGIHGLDLAQAFGGVESARVTAMAEIAFVCLKDRESMIHQVEEWAAGRQKRVTWCQP